MTMPFAPTVSIIIPVFNKWDMTRHCLESVRAHVDTGSVQVVVVDNGSTDETPALCPALGASLFGTGFLCLTNESNLGFARACNAGAEKSTADVLLFLNNDTLLANDIIPPLLAELGRKNVGCCGPMLLYPETDRIQHMGIGFLHSKKCTHIFRDFPRDHRVTQKRLPLQAISAAVLMIRAGLFHEVGGFHQGYVNGYEDLDLCHQIRKMGLKSTLDTHTAMYHLEGKSAGRFDHEHDNFREYDRRVGNGFDTDMDIIARVNDMDLVINEWFEPYCVPNQEIHQGYAARVRDKGPETALDILEEDPSWEAGYHALISFFLERGRPGDALGVAQGLYNYCPSLQAVDTLVALSKKAGRAEHVAAYVRQKQVLLDEMARSRPGLIAKALHAQARRQGRQYLETVLARWMARHGA